ncbi:helix-turn-helix domain-containing protein [Streptococcus macacae]|uniref:DNA-binding helix-turn-helix protein n=1 Tax=Streptococcus macacae NCTC 11558 TaxID=764298 RepID=G5JWX4_9STRE|nr:helix-turn-helix domain-containing protein [Streptococcus macacae]EHJ51883.1 DNA-binding helix-turn-helix protein [Streptococcus macacae NCTC 11558]SUN79450.1 transcriptional regulator [Streptococcus macacae NCTC 11558]
MKQNITSLIKVYRKKRGLTQSELAKGICTQAIISKLENSEVSPSTDNFVALCKKLEIPTSEILKILEFKPEEKHEEFFFSEEFQTIYYKQDFEAINKFIEKFISFDSLNDEEKVYYEWLNATLDFYCRNNQEEAIAAITKIIENHSLNSLKLYDRIVQSLAIMYHIQGDEQKALELFKTIAYRINASISLKFKVSSLFYLAEIHRSLNDNQTAHHYISQAIDLLITAEDLFKLGELFLQESEILYSQELYTESWESCNKAIAIFDIENKNFLKTKALSLKVNIKKHL